MLRAIYILFFLLSAGLLLSQNTTKFCDFTNQDDFIVINKTAHDKLASNSVRKVCKSPDGYIFISTYNGISIYDGQEFLNFNSENTPSLKSNSIYDFCFTPDSAIWIATQKGITIFKNFQFYNIEILNVLDKYAIQKIICDQDGTIWIGTLSDGLFYYKNNKLSKFNKLDPLEKNIISVLYNDREGKIWVGAENGNLYYIKDDKVETVVVPKIANGVFAAFQDTEGNYYFGSRNGIYTYRNDSFILLNKDINFINDIQQDNVGKIWFATNSGLYCYNKFENQVFDFSKRKQINKQIIQSIFFDDENIMWVSTYRKGLIQIRTSAFYNYPFKESNIDEIPSSILFHKNGAVWVGTDEENIYELKNSVYTKIKLKSNLNGGRIKSLFQDTKGDVWVCTYGGLIHIREGKETIIGGTKDFPDKTIRNILQNKEGNYWVGTRQSGLYKITREHKILKHYNTNNGLSSNYVLSTFIKNNKLYVATKGGIDIIFNDEIIKHYNQNTGLLDNMVFDLYIDENKVIWAATIKGLSRIENGKITNFNESNSLKINKIFSIIEDNYGFLWLPTIKGLMRIEKSKLNDYVNDSTTKIRCAFYNQSDGIYDAQYVGATHMVKSANGTIYFNTISGISIVDPKVISEQKSYPKIIISDLSTEKGTFYRPQNAELEPGTKYVDISFSYIDFINPNKASFRYKLLPFDNEWVTNKKRKIQYTNLSPGNYEFIIEAIPDQGEHKPLVYRLKFRLLPAFYQTILFRILVGIVLLLIVYLIIKIRTKALSINQLNLEKEIKERTREITLQKEEIAQKSKEVLLHQNQIEQAYFNLKLLSDLGREITTHLTLEKISSSVYQHVNDMMDATIFGIGIYNKQTNSIEFNSSVFKGRLVHNLSIPVTNNQKCLISNSFVNNEEILIHDAQFELAEGINSFHKTSSLQAGSSIMILPIIHKDETIGVITTQSYRKNAYSDYQLKMLSSLSVYVGIAIENSKIYKKITKQKDELQKVNEAKDKMFSIIGHDLRGPVGTIKSFLDMIIENPEMTESGQTLTILKTMQQSLGSAYNLLDNLLLWARSQRGKIDFKPRKFTITQPIDESISLVLESAKNKNIELVKEINYTGYVIADQVMITTVLRNLISNAIKFTPKDGIITVYTKLKLVDKEGDISNLVEVSVIDTGIGLSDKMISRILKLSNTYTTLGTDKEQGSGLGINICIDFLKRHNQQLFIENNEKTEKKPGSKFTFYLPAESE